MLTEAEAAMKWCPLATASHTDPRSGFHADDNGRPKTFACLGSACMAWRWGEDRATKTRSPPLSDREVAEGLSQPVFYTKSEKQGYCGSFGATLAISPHEDKSP